MYQALFGKSFQFYYDHVYSDEKLDLIDDFIDHYEQYGLAGWKGKISASWKVSDDYPDAKQRIQLAKKYDLHHVHIGLPYWVDKGYGYLSSDQVIHFKKINSTCIMLLSISTHNPMDLPSEEIINDE